MDQSNAAKPPRAGANAADVRQHQLGGVPDDDVMDLSAAVDQNAHLTSRGVRHGPTRARVRSGVVNRSSGMRRR